MDAYKNNRNIEPPSNREYVHLPFQLFTIEQLERAAEVLKIEERFVDIYRSMVIAQNEKKMVTTMQVRASQATHKKIQKYLTDIGECSVPQPTQESTMSELAMHILNLEKALQFLKKAQRG